MAGKLATSLRGKVDAAWNNLTRQLQGMEPHLERADAPGEWTTRQVLCHLLSPPGWNPAGWTPNASTRSASASPAASAATPPGT